MKSILDFWPMPQYDPRDGQIYTLERLEASDKKYKLVQAPVGAGKSLIGVTYAEYCKYVAETQNNHSEEPLKAAFYLTPQIVLQKQYETSFPDDFMASLYGKSNYPCKRIQSTCDVGSALKKKCPGGCPFAMAKGTAQRAEHVVLNYKLALLQFLYTQTWGARHLIVHDECHGLEEYLTELSAPSTNQMKAEKYGTKWKQHQTLDTALDWVSESYLPAASKHHSQLYSELREIIEYADHEPTQQEARKLKELNALEEHIDEFQALLLNDRETLRSTVVLVTDDKSLKFKPLSGADIFQSLLADRADNHLFMSSTILNPEGYCKDLGIDPDDAEFIDITSDFPVEKRPVFYMPQCKMNASWNQPENAAGRGKMSRAILDITEMHKEDSGIIHTGNFKIAEWVVRLLEDMGTHNIWHHNPNSGDNRNDIIEAFQKDTKPAILVSPSITEGLDLKDDLARFAIFAKVPFGFLGDQWIKQRMKMSQEWYQRRTLIDVIQGGGRVVRSASDWGNTYILDESWGYLYKRANKYIPQWWKDGYLVKS